MYQYYALHKIAGSGEFSFSPSDYSLFKYGDGRIAAHFGKTLAQGFIKEKLAHLKEIPQLIVVSSPYAFIPTATFAMKDHFTYTLNRWLAAQNQPVLQEVKIHRKTTYRVDYGKLTAEERLRLIGQDEFYIDKVFLENKTLILLDDIKITGTHEIMIKRTLKQQAISNDAYFMYFAELTNSNIHPNIESFLNNYTIKSINDLDNIIQSKYFRINTRIVKFILNSDTYLFEAFINRQSKAFQHLLYDMAIGNDYHNIEAYQKNLDKLSMLANEAIINI